MADGERRWRAPEQLATAHQDAQVRAVCAHARTGRESWRCVHTTRRRSDVSRAMMPSRSAGTICKSGQCPIRSAAEGLPLPTPAPPRIGAWRIRASEVSCYTAQRAAPARGGLGRAGLAGGREARRSGVWVRWAGRAQRRRGRAASSSAHAARAVPCVRALAAQTARSCRQGNERWTAAAATGTPMQCSYSACRLVGRATVRQYTHGTVPPPSVSVTLAPHSRAKAACAACRGAVGGVG